MTVNGRNEPDDKVRPDRFIGPRHPCSPPLVLLGLPEPLLIGDHRSSLLGRYAQHGNHLVQKLPVADALFLEGADPATEPGDRVEGSIGPHPPRKLSGTIEAPREALLFEELSKRTLLHVHLLVLSTLVAHGSGTCAPVGWATVKTTGGVRGLEPSLYPLLVMAGSRGGFPIQRMSEPATTSSVVNDGIPTSPLPAGRTPLPWSQTTVGRRRGQLRRGAARSVVLHQVRPDPWLPPSGCG